MEPGGSMLHSQGLSNNPYPEPNQPNSLYWSILILFSHLRLGLPRGLFPAGVPVKILKALLPSSILATWPAHSQSARINHPDYIRRTVQTMKFLIVDPSPLPILIPLGSKYSLQDLVFKYPWRNVCIYIRSLYILVNTLYIYLIYLLWWGVYIGQGH